MCVWGGVFRGSTSFHVALIYADTVKLQNTNCIISTENRCDNFSAPHPAVLTESDLQDTLEEWEPQGVPACGPCLLLVVLIFPFSSWETRKVVKYLQEYHRPASGKYSLLSDWLKLCPLAIMGGKIKKMGKKKINLPICGFWHWKQNIYLFVFI